MKIIIAGAGAVGSHLATLLSHEAHDIILIDADPARVATASDGLDILTLTASPSSIATLREAGTQQAGLFIAVTPQESTNITCCCIAHKIGAKKTVARIDNDEYLDPRFSQSFHEMGIDSLIYPEALAAREIVTGVRRSWVRQYWEVHDGALIIMGIKLREGAQALFGKPIYELCPADSNFHIVTIKRDNDTIIPDGNDILCVNDIVYFATKKKYVNELRTLVGKDHYPDVHKMIIMGGGDITVQTCRMLPDDISATVIESNRDRCHALAELIDNDNIDIVHGDGRDSQLLNAEGISHYQAFCALTHDTENNILACLAAKRMGVSKTVALVEKSDYVSLAERLDIGTIINTKNIAASHIYQQLLQADVTSVKNLTIADADVAEFIAVADSPITSHSLRDLRLPKGITVGGIVRDGVGILCNGTTEIQPGDIVVVFYYPELFKQLDKYFKPKKGLFNS